MIDRATINELAQTLKFPYDHSRQHVGNLDKLVELVRLALERLKN